MHPSHLGASQPSAARRPAPTERGYRLGERPPNYGKTYPPELLEPDEVVAIMRAWRGGLAGARNRALTIVLYRSGLRIAEALALLPKDIDFARRRIHILRGKGHKRRVVGMDAMTIAVLEEWLELRAGMGLAEPSSSPIFCVVHLPNRGRAMRPQLVNDAIKRASQKAGIERRAHAHGLRHTFADNEHQDGQPLYVIQGAMGHGRASYTDAYLHRLGGKKVVEAMVDREPPPGFELPPIVHGGQHGAPHYRRRRG